MTFVQWWGIGCGVFAVLMILNDVAYACYEWWQEKR